MFWREKLWESETDGEAESVNAPAPEAADAPLVLSDCVAPVSGLNSHFAQLALRGRGRIRRRHFSESRSISQKSPEEFSSSVCQFELLLKP